MPDSSDASGLLQAWGRGDLSARDRFIPFFGVASQMMRCILVDRARTVKGTRRRDGHWIRVPFDSTRVSRPPLDVSVLDLDGALTELGLIHPRKSRIAELRFFAGLTIQE